MKIWILTALFFPVLVSAKGLIGITLDPDRKSAMPLVVDELHPFVSDGCSVWPNGTSAQPNLWLHCCIAHDAKYWLGGTEDERLQADEGLRECVAATGSSTNAWLMYNGVRMGGGPTNEKDYRWGFGWTRIHDYRPLTEKEMDQAKALYGEHLEGLEQIIRSKKYVEPTKSHSYTPPLDYTFCEEQVLVYINDHLKNAAQITNVSKYMISNTLHHKITINLCKESIDFSFTEDTSSASCNHDFIYSKFKNKISQVFISPECKVNFTP